MANLQVKDVPDDIHRALQRLARRSGRTMRDIVLDAVRRKLDQKRFEARLSRRSAVTLGVCAAAILEEARHDRSPRD